MGGCVSTEAGIKPTHQIVQQIKHESLSVHHFAPRNSTDSRDDSAHCDLQEQQPHQQLPLVTQLQSNVQDVGSIVPGEDIKAVVQSYELLQQLALLSTNPLMALQEAAALIAQHSGADIVGISAFAGGDTDCAVWLMTYGGGSLAMEQHLVMRGPGWSAADVQQAEGGRLSVQDAAWRPSLLSADIASVYSATGMGSFEVLLVAPPGGQPLGTLLVAKSGPNGFGQEGQPCPPSLSVAKTALMQVLRQTAVQQVAKLQRSIGEAADPVAAIGALLEGTSHYLWQTTNTVMVVRLALLEDGGSSGNAGEALVFEQGQARRRESINGNSSRSNGLSAPLPAGLLGSDVTVRQLGMEGTLLERAVSLRKAWIVKDTTLYMQNSGRPARDLFSSASSHDPIKSLAVVPFLLGDRPVGALYFSCSSKVDFAHIQDTLLAMVPFVGLTLSNKLQGSMDHLRSLVAEAKHARFSQELPALQQQLPAGAAGRLASAAGLIVMQGDGGDASGSSPGASSGAPETGDAAVAALMMEDGEVANGRSSKLSVANERKLCTQLMMKTLRREIQRARRCSMELSFMSDLALHREIGRGGFGVVYMGTWRKLPAAIKVMHARGDDGEAMSDAMEMAVLSSVQHPNIVQMYSCLMDMVELDVSEGCVQITSASHLMPSLSGAPPPCAPPPPRYRRLLPNEGCAAPTYNLLVLEHCDLGTLRQAVQHGMFHRMTPGQPVGVDAASMIDVLLDVSTALQYLHDSVTLVHGDVKLDNILLKRDPSRTLGFTPKLSDFGLTKLLSPEDERCIINRVGAGTVTHMAPELFTAGTQITPAVDVYAFGIMMWEMFTGRRAYDGLPRDATIQRVLHANLRPTFPGGTPAAFSGLASDCWAANPASRPCFSDVICILRELRAGMEARASRRMAAAAAVAPLGLPGPVATLPPGENQEWAGHRQLH